MRGKLVQTEAERRIGPSRVVGPYPNAQYWDGSFESPRGMTCRNPGGVSPTTNRDLGDPDDEIRQRTPPWGTSSGGSAYRS